MNLVVHYLKLEQIIKKKFDEKQRLWLFSKKNLEKII